MKKKNKLQPMKRRTNYHRQWKHCGHVSDGIRFIDNYFSVDWWAIICPACFKAVNKDDDRDYFDGLAIEIATGKNVFIPDSPSSSSISYLRRLQRPDWIAGYKFVRGAEVRKMESDGGNFGTMWKENINER